MSDADAAELAYVQLAATLLGLIDLYGLEVFSAATGDAIAAAWAEEQERHACIGDGRFISVFDALADQWAAARADNLPPDLCSKPGPCPCETPCQWGEQALDALQRDGWPDPPVGFV